MTETKKFQVYLPVPLYERLRRQAFDQRTSINKLILAAVAAAEPAPKATKKGKA